MQLLVCHQAIQAAFKLANIGLYATGNIGDDVIGNAIAQANPKGESIQYVISLLMNTCANSS